MVTKTLSNTHTDIEKAPISRWDCYDIGIYPKQNIKAIEVTYEVKYDAKGYFTMLIDIIDQ